MFVCRYAAAALRLMLRVVLCFALIYLMDQVDEGGSTSTRRRHVGVGPDVARQRAHLRRAKHHGWQVRGGVGAAVLKRLPQ